ncbi:pyridoxamine 5'-phosphate oxidase family protein [Streptomyces sp. NPDC050610]|uniref:pyridoxamine 5'-phosphate oxidase family protein n=1 Tax=Streptomyces sp. NPDC050610 TaxID=3157097 RepID=UPI00344236BF
MGTVERAEKFYGDQVLDHLNTRMRDFVARQEMFFLATADGRGECDNSFRAGPPGFLRVLDERTLIYPEYRGNGVHASLGNLSENPHLGILMVDFTHDRIGLHINGRARTLSDAELRAIHPGLPMDPVPGRRARLWVEVGVEEAYIHCRKHIPHLVKAGKQPRETERRNGGLHNGGSSGDGSRNGDLRNGERGNGERSEGDWGTDDSRRKGGDFFGAAAQAAERAAGRADDQDRSTDLDRPTDRDWSTDLDRPTDRGWSTDLDRPADRGRPAVYERETRGRTEAQEWQHRAERVLEQARRWQPLEPQEQRESFRGWFG